EHDHASDWPALAASWQNGRIKLALTKHLLALRQRLPDIFSYGRYQALRVNGEDADQVIAFARSVGARTVIVIACRHFAATTDRGRHWFDPASCQASVDLTGFHHLRSALQPGHTFDRGVLAIGTLC